MSVTLSQRDLQFRGVNSVERVGRQRERAAATPRGVVLTFLSIDGGDEFDDRLLVFEGVESRVLQPASSHEKKNGIH